MKNRSNIMLRIASFLFICVLASTVMLSGLLARYTSTGSGGDGARVIKFGDLTITETGDFVRHDNHNDFIIVPGVEAKKDVNISFTGSEAQTYLFVKLNLNGSYWSPYTLNSSDPMYMKKFKVSYDSTEILHWSICKDWNYLDGTSYVYYKVIEPSSGAVSYDFIADTVSNGNDGKIVFSSDITKEFMKNELGEPGGVKRYFTLDINAYVVQANGFDNVNDAWASLSTK